MSTSIVIEGMLAKVESQYGTDPTPVNTTDGVRLSERVWNVMTISHEWENERENSASGTLQPIIPGTPRGRVVRLTFGVEAQVKGSTYSAITDLLGFTPLVQCCGHAAAVATSGIDFDPADTGHLSTTIYAYSGGNVYKIVGCRGRMILPINAGQMGTFRFEITGLLRAAPVAGALPSITYLAPEAPADVGLTMTVGSWAPDIESGELDGGQAVTLTPSGNAVDGIAAVEISRHNSRFRLTAPSVALTTYDPYADKVARTVRTIALTRGSGAGSMIKVQSATSYVRDVQHVNLRDFTGWTLEYIVTDYKVRFE